MDPKKVIEGYNKSAGAYADKFVNELSKKHFDRVMLEAFARENASKGLMVDFGCGPGQTTKFLAEQGAKEITGTDVSGEMIEEARKLFPGIRFEVADMLRLDYAEKSVASAVAFYAIVHFTQAQLRTALLEIKRVFKDKGQFLFSFHIGDEVIRNTNFLEKGVELDFYFFEVPEMISLLEEIGFKIIDATERHPYPEVEYPSRRAYIWVEKR